MRRQPDHKLEVAIPAGVMSVKPEQVPGWQAETVVGELAEPYESHGETITDGVLEVSWTTEPGHDLPDELFREFGLSVKLPDAAGETLWFPTIQTCEQGEIGWIQIPGDGEEWGELDAPSPYVELTAASGDGHGTDDEEPATDAGAAAPADGDEEIAVDLASADSGADTLTYAALAAGVLGAGLGTAGLAAARRVSGGRSSG